jgi:hypothetical protein
MSREKWLDLERIVAIPLLALLCPLIFVEHKALKTAKGSHSGSGSNSKIATGLAFQAFQK